MKLKSFGCSFIFGSELHDDGWGGPRATPSNHTWPALLAKHLEIPYQCFARPGAGNVRIAEQILNQIHSSEPAFYVIGWTWIERFDYIHRNHDTWNTITAWSQDDTSQFYFRDIHSQYFDKLQSLIYVNMVLDQLIKSGSQFFMTYMDDLMFETEFHCSAAMRLMQQNLRPYLHNFNGHNFLKWSQINNFPIGDRGKHPLEQAHRAAFEYVIQNHSL